MAFISLRSRGVYYGIVFILVVMFGILAVLAFLSANNKSTVKNNSSPLTSVPTSQDLCAKFTPKEVEASCEKAVGRALTNAQGRVTKVSVGVFPFIPEIKSKITNPGQKMWLVDIDLNKPIVASSGAKTQKLEIGIPLDGTNAVYRSPIKS